MRALPAGASHGDALSNSALEELFLRQASALGLPAPQREHCWGAALGRHWRFDFAWPEPRLALEVQGGIWRAGGGRHNRAAGYEADLVRAAAATCLGWRVLGASPDMVVSGLAVAYVEALLTGRPVRPELFPTPGMMARVRRRPRR